MTAFVIYLACSLGISYAWSDTEVTRPLRNLIARVPYLRKPLLCHECCSFWISLALTAALNPLQELCVPGASHVLSAFCGFFANLVFTRKEWIPFK